ncbi:MAG: hypothetical protein QM765_32150 [Myxococcales bacterium]
MYLDQYEAEGLIEELHKPIAVPKTSEALQAFARQVPRLWPERILELGDELLTAGEKSDEVARIVCSGLRAIAGDIDEHGKQAEFADSAAVVRKGLKTWEKRCPAPGAGSPFLERMMLFGDDLEDNVVAFAEKFAEKSEKAVWNALHNARRANSGAEAFATKPRSPWLMEMFAAYVGRELCSLRARAKGHPDEAKREATLLLAAYTRAVQKSGAPAFFGPRVERWTRELSKVVPALQRLVAALSIAPGANEKAGDRKPARSAKKASKAPSSKAKPGAKKARPATKRK